MASSSNSVGINWAFLARVASLAVFVFLALALRPALTCSFSQMDAVELPTIDDDASNADVNRVRGADQFSSGFFGSIGRCYSHNQIQRQPTPILGGLGISAAAAFLLTLMSRVSYRRQVVRAAAAQQRARADLEKRRTAAHTTVPSNDAPTRNPTITGGATTVSSRRPTMTADRDPLGPPMATERRPGGPSTLPSASLGGSSTIPSLDLPSLSAAGATAGARSFGAPGTTNAPPRPGEDFGAGTAVVANSNAPLDPNAAAAPAPVFGWDVDWNDDEFEKMLRKVTTSSMPAVGSSMQHPTRAGADALADALGVDDHGGSDLFGETPPAPGMPAVLGPATAEPHGDFGPVAATLEKIVMPDVVYADRDPRFGLRVSSPDPNLPSTARADVRLVTADGVPHQLWPAPRPLASLAGADALATARTAAISIPWREVATEVGRLVERGTAKGVSLRVSVSVGSEEVFAVAPILDALTLDFVADGEPIQPTIVRITSPSGRVLRAVVGTEQPGRLSLRGIDAGPYELSFEEGSLFSHQSGATAPRLSARTDAIYGLTHSRGDAQVVRRKILVVTPRVAYVSPTGSALGDGTADRPFDRVSTALASFVAAEGTGPKRPVEIRLTAGSRDLRERLDLARAPDGSVPWEAWWAERPVPTSTAWTIDVDESELRRDVRRFAAGAFRLDVAVDDLEAVRIVNAEYAEARERAARDPDRLFQLDSELARIPLVELGAPTDDIRHPFRLVVSGCADVIIEGLHFVGVAGQSGLSLVDCRAARVHRCIFEHFESGPVARSGAWAVGRGVQVERCGEPERPVEFVLCEFGWNRSTRKSMPVKGAGIAVYDASLRLTRCFLHHNVASAQPPDIYATGQSRVSGDATNHRESNRVETPARVGS